MSVLEQFAGIFSSDCKVFTDKISSGGGHVAMMLGTLPVPGVLLIWIRVEQGPTALAEGADGGCLDIFSLIYHLISSLSPFLLKTARYRLKYCLKGPLSLGVVGWCDGAG